MVWTFWGMCMSKIYWHLQCLNGDITPNIPLRGWSLLCLGAIRQLWRSAMTRRTEVCTRCEIRRSPLIGSEYSLTPPLCVATDWARESITLSRIAAAASSRGLGASCPGLCLGGVIPEKPYGHLSTTGFPNIESVWLIAIRRRSLQCHVYTWPLWGHAMMAEWDSLCAICKRQISPLGDVLKTWWMRRSRKMSKPV